MTIYVKLDPQLTQRYLVTIHLHFYCVCVLTTYKSTCRSVEYFCQMPPLTKPAAGFILRLKWLKQSHQSSFTLSPQEKLLLVKIFHLKQMVENE